MATEQQLQSAFKRGVRNIVDATRYGTLRDAISRGDYSGALSAIDIDDAAFDELRGMIVQTYAEAGVNAITGQRWPYPVRWSSATPEAEEFARQATRHMQDLAADMRAAVSWQIGDSIALGRSANRTALDLVGRIGASGKREGGIVGLNDQRTKWVADLRKKLESGEYVGNGLLTAAERRQIERGELTQAQIDRITQSYANRQLLSRGRAIARTERGLAVNMGQMEAWRQAADKGGIPYSAIIKEWRHTGVHEHERITHVAANKDTVRGLYTPFDIGGIPMQYPHDPMAPASEVINCQCRVHMRLPSNWRQYG